MAFVRMLAGLTRDPVIGRHVVPIVPDEARTFGMEGLFRQLGIYSSVGQLYEPVDAEQLMSYREAKDGQILEEGINEAGAMSSFIAAGTAYANHGINLIPFYCFYSMFGFQRTGDFAWAGADMRMRGFLMAVPLAAPPWRAKACSTRTATATCWPPTFPLAWPTIPPSPTKWRSSSRTGCAAWSRSRRTSSITSP